MEFLTDTEITEAQSKVRADRVSYDEALSFLPTGPVVRDNFSYLAGLIDGEGHVAWSSAGKKQRRFVIEISMVSEQVIDWLVQHYGGLKVRRPVKNPAHQTQWRWRLTGPRALALYERLRPLLLVKG